MQTSALCNNMYVLAKIYLRQVLLYFTFKYKNKDWKKYYAKLPDKSEAYKNIEFFLDVEVDGIV